MTDRGAHRAPCVGTHGLAVSGCRAWCGSPWTLHRHRTQGTLHPVAAGRGSSLTALAPRTPRRSWGSGVSQCPRRCPEPRWGGVPAGQTRGYGTAALPRGAAQARLTPCPAAYGRHGAVTPRCGPCGDCPLAGTCIGRDDPALCSCQSCTARASLSQDDSLAGATGPLPTR